MVNPDAGRMSMVQRISRSEGIADLNGASDEVKLDIYRITIEKLFKIFQNTNPRTFPKSSLDEIEDTLTEIISGFYDLARGPIGNKIRLAEILSPINEAASYVSAALSAYGNEDKIVDYVQQLQNCRTKLFQVTELLQAAQYTVPTPPPTVQPPTSPEVPLEAIKQGLKDADNNAIDDTAVGAKDDKLNFKIYAEALYTFITSKNTTTPLTISINGPWGMGKSSLMKMVREKLEPDEGQKYKTKIFTRRHGIPL